MTDKEMIEEMAKEIHFNYWGTCAKDNCANCPHNVLNICDDKLIAEKLYEQGYRKIPGGSVVLSLQEHENDIYSAYNRGYRSGSKETAREFAKGICKMLWNRGKDKNGKTFDYGDLTSIDVYELAKQFGVEVEE